MNIKVLIWHLLAINVLSYEHLKLEDPLDLIYEESWPYPPSQDENFIKNASKQNEYQKYVYNNQALSLLEFLNLINNESSKSITKTKYKDINFSQYASKPTFELVIFNQSNKTKENLDFNSTTTAQIKNTTEFSKTKLLLTTNSKIKFNTTTTILFSFRRTEINASKIIKFSNSTRNPERIKLYSKLKKLNNTLDVYSLNQTSCLNCSDIKDLNECKTFDDKDMAELINIFCCQCSPSM